MNILKIVSMGSVVGLLLAPTLSFAAIYDYVDVYGNMQTVQASNPQQALLMAEETGNVLNSGVKVDGSIAGSSQQNRNLYTYVSVLGEVKTISAPNIQTAFLLAMDRAVDSGILVVGPVQ